MTLNLKQVKLLRTAFLPDQLILDGVPQVAFAGRSNVGKSSLLNRLFNRKNLAKVSQTPGKTRSLNYYLVDSKYCFVDLPGFGYARTSASERERWQKLLEKYFQESQALRGLVHLIDIRHEPTELDRMLHEWTRPLVPRRLYVLTKADKIGANQRLRAAERLAREFALPPEEVVIFSIKLTEGKRRIITWVSAVMLDPKTGDR